MGNSDREGDIKKGMMSTASTLIFNKLIASNRNNNLDFMILRHMVKL